jgi:tetratricopeptide (TPR) repeat protein
MKKLSSFNIYRIECPVCGSVNEFKGVKPGAFQETGRDTDFCPVGRHWLDSRHQIKSPLLYFMATCKRCFFTHELNRDLTQWKSCPEFKSPGFEVLKRKHLQELDQKNGIIRKMGKALKPSKDPFATAVIKLLLGIYDESLKPEPSVYNLGRYYLKLGWIFREEKKKEKSAWIRENLTTQPLGETLESILHQHTDYLEKIQKLKSLVEIEFTGCGSEVESQNLRSSYYSLIDQAVDKLSSLKNSIDQLQSIFQNSQCESPAQSRNDLFKFEDFLFRLRMQWPGVPINEKEALELSLDNYKKSLIRDLKENQKIQIYYLIGELSRRIGDLNAAREYFDLTIDVGRGFIQKNKDDHLKTVLPHKILEMAYQQKEVIQKEREKVQ